MFPGWSAQRLFEPLDEGSPDSDGFGVGELIRAVSTAMQTPDANRVGWASSGSRGDAVMKLDGAIASSGEQIPDSKMRIAKKLIALARVMRLDDDETARIASLAGQVVELEMVVEIFIDPDGHGRVTYRHELFNMSNEPVSRLPREVWFEHTPKPMQITPIATGPRRTLIQRIHDTPGLAKFACQLSPPIHPGETGSVAYDCTGGQFVSDHYWRQSAIRYTRHMTITLHHQAVGRLLSYSAQEEQPGGAEISISDAIIWDNDGDDVSVTLTRDYLRPGQSVTVRWDVEHIERAQMNRDHGRQTL